MNNSIIYNGHKLSFENGFFLQRSSLGGYRIEKRNREGSMKRPLKIPEKNIQVRKYLIKIKYCFWGGPQRLEMYPLKVFHKRWLQWKAKIIEDPKNVLPDEDIKKIKAIILDIAMGTLEEAIIEHQKKPIPPTRIRKKKPIRKPEK